MTRQFYDRSMNNIEMNWHFESITVRDQLTDYKPFGCFVRNNEAASTMMGGGLVTTIIGIVIAFRVFVSIMPSTISDVKNVTAAGGTGAGWDDSEKAMWSLISLLMIVFGIFMAMFAMRQRG